MATGYLVLPQLQVIEQTNPEDLKRMLLQHAKGEINMIGGEQYTEEMSDAHTQGVNQPAGRGDTPTIEHEDDNPSLLKDSNNPEEEPIEQPQNEPTEHN